MSALCFIGRNVKMGKNVRIWHFTYVGDEAEIGDDVVIGSLCHIDRRVKIGSGTRIQGMVYIPPGTVIGRNVFIGPGVVFTNDRYPPSSRLVGAVVEDGVVIGAGALILAGVRIGARSVIGLGSVVTKDVKEGSVVVGVPARRMYGREAYERKKASWEARA
jgi:acetyltransferase-like isoleucine patch superfamily enzyme